MDPVKRTVRLVLTDGTRYSIGQPAQATTQRFEQQLILTLDPNSVFPPLDPPRGVTEKTIAQLLPEIAAKKARHEHAHNEVMAPTPSSSISPASFLP